MKSRLLGSARDYWNSYDGEENWDRAKEFLLTRYPDVQSYGHLLNKANSLKRTPGEQIPNYANRITDL